MPYILHADSTWGRFFRNAELEKMVDQDLSRLYPEHGSYFQTPGCQGMLRRILLLWCLRHPECGYRQGTRQYSHQFSFSKNPWMYFLEKRFKLSFFSKWLCLAFRTHCLAVCVSCACVLVVVSTTQGPALRCLHQGTTCFPGIQTWITWILQSHVVMHDLVIIGPYSDYKNQTLLVSPKWLIQRFIHF